MPALIKRCLCGSKKFTRQEKNGLQIAVCQDCGARHQVVEKTAKELRAWYRNDYHRGVYTHDFAHDRKVADLRLDAYIIPPGSKLLDVGCGNGAFVCEALSRGIDAIGQDIADKATMVPQRTHGEDLLEAGFPTDEFDFVTSHDVLEHVIDPRSQLNEMARVTRQGGTLFIEVPDFDAPEGRHHWRPIQHIWLLSPDRWIGLVEDCGLKVVAATKPIPGKLLIMAEKPSVERLSVLLPPGIGDSLWSLVKLQSFLKVHGQDVCDVYVEKAGDRDRAGDFVKRLPFVAYKGTKNVTIDGPLMREAYRTDGRSIIPDVEFCDYLVAFNGAMEHGRSLDQIEPELACNWDLPLHRPLKERQFGRQFRQAHGPYVVAFFVDHGFYANWTGYFGDKDILACLREVSRDRKVVIVGAGWDRAGLGQRIAWRCGSEVIDMVGKTDLDELIGLLRHADGVIGHPAGNTILPSIWGVPTVLLWWEKRFGRRFWGNVVPPAAVGRTYRPLEIEATDGATAGKALNRLIDRPAIAAE